MAGPPGRAMFAFSYRMLGGYAAVALRRSEYCACLVALLAAAFVVPASARAGESGGIAWQWAPTETLCDGNCAVTVYGGKFLETEMVKIFARKGFTPLWDWRYSEGYLLAASFSRRVGSFGRYIDIEVEAGVAKEFGIASEGELWGAFYFRWKYFPWNEYLQTTIAVSSGLNIATDISELEARRALNHLGSQVLHYFSPEATFALPGNPAWQLMIRIHHRSGAGLIDNIGGGAQFLVAGLRYHF